MMTARRRRWLAGALGAGLVAVLLALAALDNLYRPEALQGTTRRVVELYESPPPAPPPARPSDARNGGSAGMRLALENRAPVDLDVMRLDVRFAPAEPGELNLGGLGQGIGVGSGDGTGDGSGTGYELVTLSELDQQPTVLSAPVFVYPEEAVERGITEFDLRFHILIDEEGRTYPIAIVENPFPSLSNVFLEYAARVRFSPPTRLGIPVRTEYLWPVKIKQ